MTRKRKSTGDLLTLTSWERRRRAGCRHRRKGQSLHLRKWLSLQRQTQ